MSTMSSPRNMDNASTISLAGSASPSCDRCESVLRNAQEREHALREELERMRVIAERYESELASARLTISMIMKASDQVDHHTPPISPNDHHHVKPRLRRASTTEESHHRDVHIFGRRASDAYAMMESALSLHPDAPPSYEEKKWWKGEGACPRCPRGCYQVNGTRRDHYKKWHYNVYYAFVNNDDNYSERERWLCTLFGDKAKGERACLYCERLPIRTTYHDDQLHLANHIRVEHPEVFESLAHQHSRHCSNIAATQKIPHLPGEIDLLLEKTLNLNIDKEQMCH